jgi:DNA-binding XRE family transcriptional regulator
MSARDDTTAKALLGELLRLARQQSSYKTQEALARAVGIERTGITRAEGGEYPPTLQVLRDILTQTGVTGLAEVAVRGVWRLAKRGDGPAERVAPWYETTERAHALRYWSPLLVPGVAQTPEYAYEIYRADGRDHERSTEDVAARMSRQAVLDREDPPIVVITLWEAVLWHQVGSRDVMTGQLRRLLEIAERPGVLVHVLPSDIGANAGLGGPVSLASVIGEPDVLLTGGLLEDTVTSDVQQVKAALAIFERVRGIAANVVESRRIITEAKESWENR